MVLRICEVAENLNGFPPLLQLRSSIEAEFLYAVFFLK